jgi:hypothetical protein
MIWEVEYTDEFGEWWDTLDVTLQSDIADAVSMLSAVGPATGRPLVDSVHGSQFPNMKELRCGSTRILFAFDPLRVAILLIGGDKRGRWNTWYTEMIPIADRLYEEHLEELRKEGRVD